MGVVINTLGIANNYNKDSIDSSCSVGISPITKIYNLKAKNIYRQGITDYSTGELRPLSYYRKTFNGESFYLQQIGIVVEEEESVNLISTMTEKANRIVVIRNAKTKKIELACPLGGFHVAKRINGYASEYHLVIKSLSKKFFDGASDTYAGISFDFTVYEIEDLNKKLILTSTEKEVEVESYGQYNTVYDSSVKNIANFQDTKLLEAEWDDMNSISLGLDGNFIIYPYCIYGYGSYFPNQTQNKVVYETPEATESSSYVLYSNSIEDMKYSDYECYFKLLIPKSRKITKKAGLYILNLSGEYI
jgi:hypothetical protein